MSVKEIEKKWMKKVERGGNIRYNKAKTKAMFVKLGGRIRFPVVTKRRKDRKDPVQVS